MASRIFAVLLAKIGPYAAGKLEVSDEEELPTFMRFPRFNRVELFLRFNPR